MSYHDRKLISATKAQAGASARVWKSALRGINEITCTPSVPRIRFGTIADDWNAVGGDMRKSMKQVGLGK